MNGVEFLLTHVVRPAADDPDRGWEWYILDSERLHNDILHILFNEFAEFTHTLIGHDGKCTRPSPQLFDLVVRSSAGQETWIEIKVDQTWRRTQMHDQIKYVQESSNRQGRLILFSNSACDIPKSSVTSESNGRFHKISYDELYPALDKIHGSNGLLELVSAYKIALQQQEKRVRVKGFDPSC